MGPEKVAVKSHYFAAVFFAAQRAFTAATIRALPSGDILRFGFAAGAAVDLAGRPGFVFGGADESRERACWSVAISRSMAARMSDRLMPDSLTQSIRKCIQVLRVDVSLEFDGGGCNCVLGSLERRVSLWHVLPAQ